MQIETHKIVSSPFFYFGFPTRPLFLGIETTIYCIEVSLFISFFDQMGCFSPLELRKTTEYNIAMNERESVVLKQLSDTRVNF